jgi:hypothetical protein
MRPKPLMPILIAMDAFLSHKGWRSKGCLAQPALGLGGRCRFEGSATGTETRRTAR